MHVEVLVHIYSYMASSPIMSFNLHIGNRANVIGNFWNPYNNDALSLISTCMYIRYQLVCVLWVVAMPSLVLLSCRMKQCKSTSPSLSEVHSFLPHCCILALKYIIANIVCSPY